MMNSGSFKVAGAIHPKKMMVVEKINSKINYHNIHSISKALDAILRSVRKNAWMAEVFADVVMEIKSNFLYNNPEPGWTEVAFTKRLDKLIDYLNRI